MITFEKTKHLEIDENYQGINLTEFSIEADSQTDNDKIVDTFIKTKLFAFDSLREFAKAEHDNCLKQPFKVDRIKITDFRKTNKQGVLKFLFDFITESDWGDDRDDFAKLLERYLEIHNEFNDNDFYIISKDWFDKGDERVIEPESWVYTYYFLIILVDRNLNLLTLTEWTYD